MRARTRFLPKFLQQYFWGDDLRELTWEKHRKYISQTILERGDRRAARWLLKKTGKKTLKSDLNKMRLNQRSKNFWSLYLS